MRRVVRALLDRWGSRVTIVFPDESRRVVRAVLQPSGSVSWQNMRRVMRDHGQIPTGQMIYIGPTELDVMEADHLELDGKRYLPRRWEPFYLGDAAICGWGLATPMEESLCET